MSDIRRLRGQTSGMIYIDDAPFWPSNTTAITTNLTISKTSTLATSIPMGWGPRELTPEEKFERARQEKIEHEKAIKRKVLGPKRSRWG